MILDTGVWFRWVMGAPDLGRGHARAVRDAEPVRVSIISAWEVAKLVEHNRLELPEPLNRWMGKALSPSGVNLLPLTPEIAILSTQLPGNFNRDPADQIIVATAMMLADRVLTTDQWILEYPHVHSLGPGSTEADPA